MNYQNNIEKIKDVVQNEEFYYQKLKDVFDKFKNYQISQNNLKNLIQNLEFKPFSFDEYLKKNSDFQDFILLMGQIIAMSDLNGYNKQEWNLYEDKRVIAKAGVRQNDWVRNLLNYKLDGNVDKLTNSVKNALLFIDAPQNNLTQLSINHKKLVASNLLKLTFDEATYFEQVKDFFKDELEKYELKNQKNLGLLISLFLYCEEVRSLWDKNNTIQKSENEDEYNNGEDNMSTNARQPLNQILYGPPGTGKTYNTINKALEIIFNIGTTKKTQEAIEVDLVKQANIVITEKSIKLDEKKQDEPREKLKKVFEYYKEQGQIEFITFHQSYGYEEFVEGIKAIPVGKDGNKDGKEMIYDIVNGIFKNLCKNSKQEAKVFKNIDNIDFNDFLKLGQTLEAPRSSFEIKSVENDIVKVLIKNGQEYQASIKKIKKYLELEDFSSTAAGANLTYEPTIAKYIFDNLTKLTVKNYILIIGEFASLANTHCQHSTIQTC